MMGAVLAAVTLAWALHASAQTNVYRWTDKDGKVHFSDSPPPKDAQNASQKQMGGGVADQSQLPYATQVAMKRHPVAVFTAADCGELCDQGRQLLAQRGIPYRERNPQKSAADAEALRKLVGGLQVPVLLVGETMFKGFSEEGWNAALDAAGYPRTRLPGQGGPLPPPPPTAEARPRPAPADGPASGETKPQ
jgi:hypothetical protein